MPILQSILAYIKFHINYLNWRNFGSMWIFIKILYLNLSDLSYCIPCPNEEMIYNYETKRCDCPEGTNISDGYCILTADLASISEYTSSDNILEASKMNYNLFEEGGSKSLQSYYLKNKYVKNALGCIKFHDIQSC